MVLAVRAAPPAGGREGGGAERGGGGVDGAFSGHHDGCWCLFCLRRRGRAAVSFLSCDSDTAGRRQKWERDATDAVRPRGGRQGARAAARRCRENCAGAASRRPGPLSAQSASGRGRSAYADPVGVGLAEVAPSGGPNMRRRQVVSSLQKDPRKLLVRWRRARLLSAHADLQLATSHPSPGRRSTQRDKRELRLYFYSGRTVALGLTRFLGGSWRRPCPSLLLPPSRRRAPPAATPPRSSRRGRRRADSSSSSASRTTSRGGTATRCLARLLPPPEPELVRLAPGSGPRPR